MASNLIVSRDKETSSDDMAHCSYDSLMKNCEYNSIDFSGRNIKLWNAVKGVGVYVWETQVTSFHSRIYTKSEKQWKHKTRNVPTIMTFFIKEEKWKAKSNDSYQRKGLDSVSRIF